METVEHLEDIENPKELSSTKKSPLEGSCLGYMSRMKFTTQFCGDYFMNQGTFLGGSSKDGHFSDDRIAPIYCISHMNGHLEGVPQPDP